MLPYKPLAFAPCSKRGKIAVGESLSGQQQRFEARGNFPLQKGCLLALAAGFPLSIEGRRKEERTICLTTLEGKA